MVQIRSFLGVRGGVSPGRRRRRMAMLGSVAALGLGAVAGCALLSPGLVFGAGQTSAPPAKVSADADTLTASQGALLARLPWGVGPGQVGLQAPGEGLARGPEAVALSPDGRIAILDSVNGRLVILDSGGIFLKSIPVALSDPRFLSVSDDTLYVLDCDADRQLLAMDWNGSTTGLSTLPAFDDVVTGLFATDAGPCVEIAHNRTFLVAGSSSLSATGFGSTSAESKPTPGVLKALAGRPIDGSLGSVANISFKPGRSADVKLFRVDKGTLKASQTAAFASSLYDRRSLECLVSVDGDGHGGLVIGARMLSSDAATPGRPSLVLTRISAAEALAAAASANAYVPPISDTILLVDSPFAYLGQPYVVAPDGRVIQPVADDSGYSLMVYNLGSKLEVTP